MRAIGGVARARKWGRSRRRNRLPPASIDHDGRKALSPHDFAPSIADGPLLAIRNGGASLEVFESMSRARILVIDDDAVNLRLLEYHLRLHGFCVKTARDGSSGLAAAKVCQPDLILLDITMPGLDGFQVLSKLRNDPRTREIRVVMLTASGALGDIELAFGIGADDYVIKPVEPREIGPKLKRKLAR